MKKTIVVAVLISVLMLGACSRLKAMRGPFDDGAINDSFVEYVTDKVDDRLELTDAQRMQFEGMVVDVLIKVQEQRPQSESIREEMAAEVRKASLDMERIEMLMKQKMALYRNIFDLSKPEIAAFHATLNAEQREALATIILEHGKKGWHGSH